MDIRGTHIQEMEEMKLQYDIDLAEAKRELSMQRHAFEKRFKPGTAPGEILDQNHELRDRLEKSQMDYDVLIQDFEALKG